METETEQPELLASTGSAFSCPIIHSNVQEQALGDSREKNVWPVGFRRDGAEPKETNYFKCIQWSADGTCLIASGADNVLRTFVPPTDLLSPGSSPAVLTAYSALPSPEPVYATSLYPFFSLQDPSTTLLLSSPRDLPIRLSNALYPPVLATYLLVSPTTEAYLTPASMIWTLDGTQFLAGTDCLISLFDVTRNGSGPITRLPTIPSKRHNLKGGGVGMRGIVSCLSLQPSSSNTSLLAAGTWTRWVSLYDAAGTGGTVANWSIAAAADTDAKISGAGVSQTLWSPCGRYLFVIERKSRGILIYDIRVTGRLVGWLKGRAAETNQRLAADLFSGATESVEGGRTSETEIWAGGLDGVVRLWTWRGVGGEDDADGGLSARREWKAHESAVTGAAVHPSGMVVATSSGQRLEPWSQSEGEQESDSDNENDASESHDMTFTSHSPRSTPSSTKTAKLPDNSINIWSLVT